RSVERERTRQIARIGNNLNQLVRWVNTHRTAAEAVSVIAHIVSFERSLLRVARIGGETGDAR
ncbi:MAG: plasmid mobilization relaxosome protein MobC, partial [Gemmatimonadota bacterium]|nr:plasmid mobilization relaxosome protein MobC [Gemmatimonadota bacterium]